MGKINNRELTLADFFADKLQECGTFYAVTGIVSKWGLDFVLRCLRPDIPVYIIAGNLAPDIMPLLDSAFRTGGQSKNQITISLLRRRVRLWYLPRAHLKVYIVKRHSSLRNRRPGFVVTGSSNLTKGGMVTNLEQCDLRRGPKQYNLEVQQFKRCLVEAQEITGKSWPQISDHIAGRWKT